MHSRMKGLLAGPALLLVVALSACTPETRGSSGGSSRDEPLRQEVQVVVGSYAARIGPGEFRGVEAAPPEVLAGRWTLQVNSSLRSYQLIHDRFGQTEGDFFLSGGRVTFTETPAPEGTFICYVDGKRTTTEGDGEYVFEGEGGPALRLQAVEEPCPLREVLLARSWRRL